MLFGKLPPRDTIARVRVALRVVTEALKVEVAAFGIVVPRVTLGHFRTTFLGQER